MGVHEVVAFRVVLDFFEGLTCVLGQNFVQVAFGREDALGVNFDIRGLALESAKNLVDHDFRVWKDKALALGATGEQHGSHGGGHADADRGDSRLDQLHRIVDGEARGHGATGGVDVEFDVFLLVLAFQEEELGDDDVGDVIVDFRAKHDDTVLEETRVNIVSAFSLRGFLDYRWDEVVLHGSKVSRQDLAVKWIEC